MLIWTVWKSVGSPILIIVYLDDAIVDLGLLKYALTAGLQGIEQVIVRNLYFDHLVVVHVQDHIF